MTKIWSFLTGKKTYLAAIALAVLGVAGFWYAQLDAVQAGVVLSLALGLAGLGHKFDRILALLVHELDVYKKTKKLDVPAIESEVIRDVLSSSSGGSSTK